MFRKNKKVLVIGGAGFIGSHLMDTFVKGCEFISYDIANKAPKKAKQDVKSDLWKNEKYDALVFLACNFDQTEEAYMDNAGMIISVKEYLEKYPKTQIIYTSSAAVYPDLYKSMKEEDASFGMTPPTSPYGKGKLLGEFAFSDVKNATILRLSNVHGERGRGVIELFKAGEKVIYGDGEQVRDFINVGDVVGTIADALQHPRKWRGTFNVSMGDGITINRIFKLFGKGKPTKRGKRKFDVRFSVLDNTKWKKQWKNR